MLKVSALPDVNYLRSLLEYDPVTGGVFWKVDRGRYARVGTRAGATEKSGHVAIKIDSKRFKAHRIAWYLHYGVPPVGDIDHINRVPHDNRISNLRCVSRSTNLINTGIRKHNTSGCTGVHFNKRTKKWRAVLKFGGRTYWLGEFISLEEARATRKAAENVHHETKHV